MEECQKRAGLSSFIIKILAMITMVIDHSLKTIFLNSNVNMEWWYIGRMSFPLFCFLIAEGANHTRCIWKYALRILIFAIISEPIYDMLNYNSFLEFTDQNVLFELFLGLIVIWLYKFLETKDKKEYIILPLVFATFFSELLNFDYGMGGILCIFIFYIALEKKDISKLGLYAVAILANVLTADWGIAFSLQLFSFVSLIPICLYNGQIGTKINKIYFYLFYPAHLLILYLISLFLLY